MPTYSAERGRDPAPAEPDRLSARVSHPSVAKEDEMGHDDEEFEDQAEEQERPSAGPPVDEDDGGPIPPPTIETTIGFEGSIEGL